VCARARTVERNVARTQSNAYCARLSQMTRRKESNATAAPFVFTAMHGVGKLWMADALRAFGLPPYIPVREQIEPDADFPTVAFPNPEEGAGALLLAFKTAERACTRLIIANDPDADRLAVAERLNAFTDAERAQEHGALGAASDADVSARWRIFSGNEIGMLLASYCWAELRARDPTVNPNKVQRCW
jgi:phosphomannomutase